MVDRGEDFVTFKFGKETYGVSASLVGEVFPAKELTSLPGVPDFVAGVVNLRGRIVSVNDLTVLFELQGNRTSDQFVMVLRSGSMEMGFIVEPPVDIMTVPSHSIKPPIPSSSRAMEYISGICRDVVIVNGNKILSDRSLVIDGGL